MTEGCRVCSARLKGNQRRWIFNARSSVDLRAVLSHVLRRPLSRDQGDGEFVCGKCAAALERVQRFDGVVARVQSLSLERIRRLLAERDRLSDLLRRLHGQAGAGDTGEREEARRDYAALLSEDLRLAAFESWSDFGQPARCPCQNRRCYGCCALRVPDSQYDAVCRVPRRLATSRLSRSQSAGGSLDASPSPRGSDSPWATRCLSLASLPDSSEWDGETEGSEDLSPWTSAGADQALAALARQLQAVVYRPVRRPPRCKLPVLIRVGAGASTPRQRLSFAGEEEGEHGFADEYRPFNLQKLLPLGAPRQPGGERGEAGRLDGLTGGTTALEQDSGEQPEEGDGLRNYTGYRLVQSLARQLHSKEQLLQECVRLIQQLTAGDRCTSGTETGSIRSLCIWLNKWEQGRETDGGMGGVVAELEGEIERLRKAVDDKDRDVERLGRVVSLNEETINMLNASLGQQQSQVERLRSRDQRGQPGPEDRGADGIIHQQRAALHSLARDVEVLSESLLLREVPKGPDSPHSLCLQLRDKERLLTESRAELSRQRDDHHREVGELRRLLAERERQIQECELREVQAGSVHQQETQRQIRQLKERAAEVQRLTNLRTCDTHLHLAEQLHLNALVQGKDRLILGLLEDGKGRDWILSKLQEQIHTWAEPKVNLS
ncbi:uncharacterized protein LOC129695106 [Leucoraja erinacea]|uniref:uncharacterized protein LOC129695106 n=1 Tax=Leucoraja erinaceus TaxID=7782 RepID=UPI00245502B5|nr:uncharacterized protein LOC129695106 [Leucoraja erinacea]XP_055487830.1 uncharacterized protein LOC129695106 [Leucoraja erinacea]